MLLVANLAHTIECHLHRNIGDIEETGKRTRFVTENKNLSPRFGLGL